MNLASKGNPTRNPTRKSIRISKRNSKRNPNHKSIRNPNHKSIRNPKHKSIRNLSHKSSSNSKHKTSHKSSSNSSHNSKHKTSHKSSSNSTSNSRHNLLPKQINNSDKIQELLVNITITEKCPDKITEELLIEHIVPKPLHNIIKYTKEQLWDAYYNVVYNKHASSDIKYIKSTNNNIHFNDFGLYLDKNTLHNDKDIYIILPNEGVEFFNPMDMKYFKPPDCNPFNVTKNNIKFGPIK